MHIVIAGGSGFLGSALTRALRADGHQVSILTRHPRAAGDVRWSPGTGDRGWIDTIERAGAVINLAGASIATRRWTAARKRTILESRRGATQALVDAITRAATPPVLISSSAVGIYGVRGDEPVTEDTPAGDDFLATVCREWEAAALAAAGATRVVLLRTGLVLSQHGGALVPMALPVRLFAGGRVGSGRQYMSWIHLADWVAMARWALVTPAASGAINLTAPNPVTNDEFMRTLGRVLRRPVWLPAPAFALRLALGEMADALMLGGQRVLPARAHALGYEFRFPALESALREVYEA